MFRYTSTRYKKSTWNTAATLIMYLWEIMVKLSLYPLCKNEMQCTNYTKSSFLGMPPYDIIYHLLQFELNSLHMEYIYRYFCHDISIADI